jgi:intein/homing endonuclease
MRGGEYILNLDKVNEKEKGYLLGLFKGDGYSFHNKKDRHYSVEFYLNSKRNLEIIKQVCLLIKKLNLNPLLMKDKRFECMRIRTNSKNFFNFINQDFNNNFDNTDFSIGFVSGFLDAEGYVNDEKKIMNIVNTNYDLIQTSSKILNRLGIKNKISLRKKSKKDKLPTYLITISVKFKSLNHLSIKAGSRRL